MASFRFLLGSAVVLGAALAAGDLSRQTPIEVTVDLGSPGGTSPAMTSWAYGYLVHHDLVGDAAQRGFLLDRLDRLFLKDRGDRRRIRSPGR